MILRFSPRKTASIGISISYERFRYYIQFTRIAVYLDMMFNNIKYYIGVYAATILSYQFYVHRLDRSYDNITFIAFFVLWI